MYIRYFRSCVLVSVLILLIVESTYAQVNNQELEQKVDTRIWSQSYWLKMANLGLVEVAPTVPVKLGVYMGSRIDVLNQESPDVPITDDPTVHQSENSVFIHPLGTNTALNSNNSTDWPVTTYYGTSAYFTTNGSSSWDGYKLIPSGSNSGDPAAVIGLNEWYYVGGISNSGGQEVNYSTDEGATWTKVHLPVESGEFADKNHLWVDNSPISLYADNLYSAWTAFGGPNNYEIELDFSADEGLTWSGPVNISSAVEAGSHNQGVNIQTGPNGEVYTVWAIYDSYPSDENAIGFAKSTDGGATWEPATRIIENIRGIRITGTSKNMRVASFPVMAVDVSNGSSNIGNIYVVWANIGVPGVNTGSDIDIYMIKSTDGGDNWSSPIRVNQDPSGLGKEHYLPWITCDPETGALSVIFYDDRNVASSDCEVYVANSLDGGDTWVDFKVSDASFTPTPIPGCASGYFGDYLGISGRAGQVYPVWTSNYTGQPLAYVSPLYLIADDLVLRNIRVGFRDYCFIGKTKTYKSKYSIETAGSDTYFIIKGNGSNGSSATMETGNYISLKPGFEAQEGCYFKASIDASLKGGVTVASLSREKDPTQTFTESMSEEIEEKIPTVFSCAQNYPNPLALNTTIKYGLPKSSNVNLTIFNLAGQAVRTLVNGQQPAGYRSVKWDGKNNAGVQVPKGVYFYVFKADDFEKRYKMIAIK